jgi:AraC family transcriptional regulator, regulatory protein of adaptative response / methylated-DNA-[protein]-cysteine methyltransferase
LKVKIGRHVFNWLDGQVYLIYCDFMLDFQTCNEARLRQDATYDGLFFVAVRTTGVYCRPICRAGPALTKNVAFYPSAAAAERAGFRPCLRCRPESSPFCPAWQGTRSTVARALKLIDGGILNSNSVEELSQRLGVGPRHLSRLFMQHVGASPVQVAKTRRVAKAKSLLDETDLPLNEIALQSGFKSMRRMSDAFGAVYGRPPHDLRRSVSKMHKKSLQSQGNTHS